jgi:RNA polymerase sigma-70 factor, ECF subfamily
MAENADLSRKAARREAPVLSAVSGAGRDSDLLAAVVRGDGQAFRALMDRHLAPMVSVARHMTRDSALAEDIAQDAFLRLWRSAGSIEVGEAGVRPWLRRVVANLSIDRLRLTSREVVSDELPEASEPASQLRGLEQAELSVRVGAALDALPDRQRVALSLFHYEGMSQIDIASAMQISADAVESLLARARRQLRQTLQREWKEMMPGADD